MTTKAQNSKWRAVCPPLEGVIMKTIRVHSAADVVMDSHVFTELKYCSFYWIFRGL
jgi:hypothetical protein